MSRGRPKHQASRRRAYSVRQQEVRERRERLAPDGGERVIDAFSVDDAEPLADAEEPSGTVQLPRPAPAV